MKTKRKLAKYLVLGFLTFLLVVPFIFALLYQARESKRNQQLKEKSLRLLEQEKEKLRESSRVYHQLLTPNGKKEIIREKLNLVEKGEVPVEVLGEDKPLNDPEVKKKPGKP